MIPSAFDLLRCAALHALMDLRAAGKVARRGRLIKAGRLCFRATKRLENILTIEEEAT